MVAVSPVGWGIGPWGKTPWGSGSIGALQLVTALAVAENVVRLGFNAAPLFTNAFDPKDAADPERYQIVSVGGIGLDGEPIRDVLPVLVSVAAVPGAEGSVLEVTTDRAFSQYPCIYRVVVNGLFATSGEAIVPGSSLEFYGVQKGFPPQTADTNSGSTDFANPQTGSALLDPIPGAVNLSDLVLGTFPTDSLNDYATDEGLTSYTKRVLRRLVTRKGIYPDKPTYGVGIPDQVKKLGRAGVRESLAADAEQQIRLEPETVAVRVYVLVEGALTRFVVKAKTKFGPVNLSVPFKVGLP